MLAAYGVGGGPGLAYGIILQAVEVLTALALGVPALLREGLTWRDIRADSESERARVETAAQDAADHADQAGANAAGAADVDASEDAAQADRPRELGGASAGERAE